MEWKAAGGGAGVELKKLLDDKFCMLKSLLGDLYVIDSNLDSIWCHSFKI